MPPAVQDSFLSNVFFDVNFSKDDAENVNEWTHFDDGNAFADFKRSASSPNTTKTWESSSFEDSLLAEPSAFSNSFSSPLHHKSNSSGSSSSPSSLLLKKQPITPQDQQKVQLLVHAIRKEYQDVNTEAAQQKMVQHFHRLQQQKVAQRRKLFSDPELAFLDDSLMMEEPRRQDDVDTINARAGSVKTENDTSFDPFNIISASLLEEDEDDTQKPITEVNTDTEDAFSDDDTLTLSLYSEEEDEYERAERIHVLKESVMAILTCTICSDPMALFTVGNNYDDVDAEDLNVSNEEIQVSVEESIDQRHDEIRL